MKISKFETFLFLVSVSNNSSNNIFGNESQVSPSMRICSGISLKMPRVYKTGQSAALPCLSRCVFVNEHNNWNHDKLSTASLIDGYH